MLNITLNGQTIQTKPMNLLTFLQQMHQTHGRFAIEINEKLIPKNQLDKIELENNMVIEVVQAVGGG